MKLTAAILWGESHLQGLTHSDPKQESFWLLKEASGEENLFLWRDLSQIEWENYQNLIDRRKKGTPLSYLIKKAEFMGLDFEVNENVLIPRPETEVLGDLACELCKSFKNPTVLEIGTGSGILAVTIAHRVKNVSIVATDISSSALRIAQRNAAKHPNGNKIKFLESSLYDAISSSFDVIVSNPPYIKNSEIAQLQPEVQREPRVALDGGADGLGVIFPMIDLAQYHLNSPGYLIIEIGDDQAKGVLHRMEKNGFTHCEVFQDCEAKDRVVRGEWHG